MAHACGPMPIKMPYYLSTDNDGFLFFPQHILLLSCSFAENAFALVN